MKGLLLVAGGKPKSKGFGKPPAEEDEDLSAPVEEEAGSAEEDYAREAFSAVSDGDEEGFVQSFLGAVRACAGKAKSGGYEDEE